MVPIPVPHRRARSTTFVALGVLIVAALNAQLASGYRRLGKAPAERWPNFYDVGWDGVDPVYTSMKKVSWMAPFFSGTGLGSEATLFALGVEPYLGTELVIDQHGDKTNYRFVNGVQRKRHKQLTKMASRSAMAPFNTIYVCQSNPDLWDPKPKALLGNRCPEGGGARYKIGRTQVETDSLPMDWPAKLNKMDEVWVPSRFHKHVFARKGVDESKIVVVPQAADLDFFNPASVSDPMVLPGDHIGKYKLLSILSWEHRKGWDVLLRSFLTEFKRTEPVVLYILTPEHRSTEALWTFLEENLDVRDVSRLPHIEALPYVAQRDMPALYKAVDAFVLPSRGEGWGRTITEAMCMELPVIATAWGGPTAYLNEENSFPLPVSQLASVPDGPMAGQRMAEPDMRALRRLMRQVVSAPDQAAARGRRARRDMHEYSPDRVGRFIAHHLAEIADNLDGSMDDL